SADLPAVLDTIAAETVRLAGADDASVWRRDPDGVRIIAAHGRLVTEHGRQAIVGHLSPLEPGWSSARSVLERITIHIADLDGDEGRPYPRTREACALRGWHTALSVPLLRGDECIGLISAYRYAPQAFTDQQIRLVETFADQAVIAIENS